MIAPSQPAGKIARIQPGVVRVAGRLVEYAVGRSIGGATAVWVVGVSEPTDERALLLLAAPPDLGEADLKLAIDAAVYRRVVAAQAGIPEVEVAIPGPIGTWPLGTTEADIAAERAAQIELPEHPGVVSMDRFRGVPPLEMRDRARGCR
jgi:hypothetical protein